MERRKQDCGKSIKYDSSWSSSNLDRSKIDYNDEAHLVVFSLKSSTFTESFEFHCNGGNEIIQVVLDQVVDRLFSLTSSGSPSTPLTWLLLL